MRVRNELSAFTNEARNASKMKKNCNDSQLNMQQVPLLLMQAHAKVPVKSSSEQQENIARSITKPLKVIVKSVSATNNPATEHTNRIKDVNNHSPSKSFRAHQPLKLQPSTQHLQDAKPITSKKDFQFVHTFKRKHPSSFPVSDKRINIPRSLMCELIPLKVFFQCLLRKRGYSKDTYSVLETAYYNKPTPYQQASYGIEVTRAARSGNVHLICKLIKCGLSLNPCNKFSESLLHIISRRGKSRNAFQMLSELSRLGSQLHLCDDFGRTPLHDACWTVDPCFRTISLFLDKDVNMLRLIDRRGSTPLDYVEKANQKKFIEFFLSKKDTYWPMRDPSIEEPPPPLTFFRPHSRIISDPSNAMSLDLVSCVAAGKVSPEEAMLLYPDERKYYRIKKSSLQVKRKKIGSIF